MAHDETTRTRARGFFIAGRPLGWIARSMGVSRPTLQRWKRDGAWEELRGQNRQLEREAQALALAMTKAARESEDPQQAYAALQAAKMAGLAEAQPLHPAPAEVAKVFLRALNAHAALGPLLRRHRDEVLETVTRELEHLER